MKCPDCQNKIKCEDCGKEFSVMEVPVIIDDGCGCPKENLSVTDTDCPCIFPRYVVPPEIKAGSNL